VKHALREYLVVAGFFLALSALYFSDTFNYWFILDDPAAMVSSLDSVADIFLVNSYSFSFYTPLLPLSFKPEVKLFGMNPFPYHIHNMVILVLTALMVYLIIRRYTDTMSSLISSVLVLFSSPSLVCVTWITLRQYLYAMFFALAAVYLYVKYNPDLKHKRFILFLILIFSELSFMGKEQYTTLPFVLFILSEGGVKQRVLKTIPFFLLLAGHFFLRWYVLGGIGGYVGAHYDHDTYLKSIFLSVLTESRVLFGFPWIIFLVLMPFIQKPKKLLTASLLWLAALLVSFAVMNVHPSGVTYRYWFMPTILFSFAIGLGAALIKNRSLKVLYLIAIAVVFLSHSFSVNKDVKIQFEKESARAKQMSAALTDKRYQESIILFPEGVSFVESFRTYYFSMAFQLISGTKIFPTLYPLELLAFYPEILKNYKSVYRIEDGVPVDVTGSIRNEMDAFRISLSGEKPDLKLLRGSADAEISLRCKSGRAIVACSVKRRGDKYYASKDMLPYLERVPLHLGRNIVLLPVDILSHRERDWYIGEEKMEDGATFITGLCLKEGGTKTKLSDILYYSAP
jgi:hypothetical protein